MNAKSAFFLLCLLTAVFMMPVACDEKRYEIIMEVDGPILTRQITMSDKNLSSNSTESNDGQPSEPEYLPLPEDEIMLLQKLYPEQLGTSDENVLRFKGTFVGKTPQDVGGHGVLTYHTSSMGSAGVYMERFRGEHLAAQIIRGQQAADRITNHLIGWFACEMKADRRFAALRQWLDTEVRYDLKNLNAMLIARSLRASELAESNGDEWLVRAIQYLLETGYITTEDLPVISRASNNMDDVASAGVMKIIRRMVADKTGIAETEKLPDSLAFLGDMEKMNESLAAYLRTTDDYKALLPEWEKEQAANPEDPPGEPDPLAIIEEDFFQLIIIDKPPIIPTSQNAYLDVTLKTPVEPFSTNGTYDKDSHQVKWERVIERKNGTTDTRDAWARQLLSSSAHSYKRKCYEAVGLPSVLYAAWAQPDEKFQNEHFGKVVFSGKDLLLYCLWEKSLTEEEAAEWSEFVASLNGKKDDVITALTQFGWSNEAWKNFSSSTGITGRILMEFEEDEDASSQPDTQPASQQP